MNTRKSMREIAEAPSSCGTTSIPDGKKVSFH